MAATAVQCRTSVEQHRLHQLFVQIIHPFVLELLSLFNQRVHQSSNRVASHQIVLLTAAVEVVLDRTNQCLPVVTMAMLQTIRPLEEHLLAVQTVHQQVQQRLTVTRRALLHPSASPVAAAAVASRRVLLET